MKKRDKIVGKKLKKRNIPSIVALTVAALAVLLPALMALINSFKPIREIEANFLAFDVSTFTLDAYRSVITVLRFEEGLWNNLIVTAMSLLFIVLCGSLMAFAISVVNSKFLRGVYLASILLICIPINAMILQEITVLRAVGLLNSYLGTSLVFTAISLPVAVFLYTGFMRTLPKELTEAAIVDGCSLWRIYAQIYMPLMKPITGTVVILRATYIWNDLLVSLVTISNPTMTMLVPRMYAFNSSTATRWDLVLASSVLVSIPITVLYLCLQKYFIRGLVEGAVKG